MKDKCKNCMYSTGVDDECASRTLCIKNPLPQIRNPWPTSDSLWDLGEPGMLSAIPMKEDNKMKLRIKYFEGATKLQKISVGNWIDVYANKDVFVKENESALIPLGFALEIPKGWEGHLVPRSSTFKTWGIIQTNSMGIVDDTFIGDNDEWCMPVFCIEPRAFTRSGNGVFIKKGDKIGQFRIIESMPEIEFEEVDMLNNVDRGGFGTTGTTKISGDFINDSIVKNKRRLFEGRYSEANWRLYSPSYK